jgi:hypothetical protein
MVRALQAADLATLPADKTMPSKTGTNPGVWFEVANLSPYAFELLDDAGQVRAIAGPFNYTAIPMMDVSDHITLHPVATQTTAPTLAADWKVYAGLTKRALTSEKFA